MLEPRSYYGYYGSAGGVTGEVPPDDRIEKNISYWEYKHRYPECETLGDYDKAKKTITVLIPSEYTERPNYGNHYSINTFYFEYSPAIQGISPYLEIRAKNYTNAMRQAKTWANRNKRKIVGDKPGSEYQREFI
jgi:hypothetical protein